MNRLTESLDRTIAWLALIASMALGVALFIFFPSTAFKYIEIPILIFLGSILYLSVVRKRLRQGTDFHEHGFHMSSPVYTLLSILFVIVVTIGISSVLLRSDAYSRPLVYFIAMTISVILLSFELIFTPEVKYHTPILLAKIVFIALVLRITPLLVFPELIGIDPLAHRAWITEIIDSGNLVAGYEYSNMPVFSLMISSVSLITGLEYKYAAFSAIGFPMIISLGFVFLIGKMLVNKRVGLLACLLLAIAPFSIDHAVSARPISMATALMPMVLYFMFKATTTKSRVFALITLVFCGIAILTHTVGAFTIFLAMLLIWFITIVVKKLKIDNPQPLVSAFFPIVLIAGMLIMWIFVSGQIAWIVRIMKTSLSITDASWLPTTDIKQYLSQYWPQYMMSELGFTLIIATGFIGLMSLLNIRLRTRYIFPFTLAILLFVAIAAIGSALNLTGLALGRWYPGVEVLIAIPAAVAVFAIVHSSHNRIIRGATTTTIVALLAFFTLTSPFADQDNLIYTQNVTSRHSLIESEITAQKTLDGISRSRILTDVYYSWYFNWEYERPQDRIATDATGALVSGNFSDIAPGMIVIRKEITTNTFEAGGGAYKLDYDPIETIDTLSMDRIYHSVSVIAYLDHRY